MTAVRYVTLYIIIIIIIVQAEIVYFRTERTVFGDLSRRVNSDVW